MTLLQTEVVLENQRALLRPLRSDDAGLLESVAFEPTIWTLGMDALTNRTELEKYIARAMDERARGVSYPFIIFDKNAQRWAGSSRYGNISQENKRVEIGWTWIGKDFQGTGLNKACKFELFRFAFEKLGCNRVELKTDALNQRSRKAMKKVGCVEEGTLRAHQITSKGRIRDSVFFSITHNEWPQVKASVFAEFTS